jgi:hypothetical protein
MSRVPRPDHRRQAGRLGDYDYRRLGEMINGLDDGCRPQPDDVVIVRDGSVTMTVTLEVPMGDSRPVMIVGPMQMFGRRDNGERDRGREK